MTVRLGHYLSSLYLSPFLPYLLYYGHSPFAPRHALQTVPLSLLIYYTPCPHPYYTTYACVSAC
jgi:hypothetical protein